MDLFDLLEAMVKLGIPLFLFSWLLVTKLYDGGEINRDGNNVCTPVWVPVPTSAGKWKDCAATSPGLPSAQSACHSPLPARCATS